MFTFLKKSCLFSKSVSIEYGHFAILQDGESIEITIDLKVMPSYFSLGKPYKSSTLLLFHFVYVSSLIRVVVLFYSLHDFCG